ncbi:MAG TPA: DNA polymerase III subunit alpha, partial [Spirochaetota bacterium]|nr:DNA polymerase III subunit alpha [Spirochaetota bacterium]
FSFANGHSASYAVESYQSLYLKAHHPMEFLVGVANNFGGFYHTEFYLHEAKRIGATIEAPCVNTSEGYCTLHDKRIFLGLRNIKSLEEGAAQLIQNERQRSGPFMDLQDLLRRVPLHMEQARVLARVGALRFTGRSKPQLLWDLAMLHHGRSDVARNEELFMTKVADPKLPELNHYPLADAYDELDLLGFPLCDPFSLVDRPEGHEPPANGFSSAQPEVILARQMGSYLRKRVEMLGYMIHVKATDTHTGQRMSFGSFIDTAGDFWDSTQFPDVAARFPFRGRGVYRLVGHVEEEFGHCSLRTQFMEKLPWRADPRYGEK